ncbi:MAG: tripartite tricarboxylate transporter substrate binding protein [Alphaproteobacteria bacterium]|nr:tripartite tricarboxylate transporter substrate binding protein [Alphaproteobacteria bacterium]
MIVRRKLLRIGAAAAAFPAPALAQAWPSKPIRIVCTYPPGGLTDIYSRAYGEFVSAKLGQPVVVDNKSGAAGAIGAEVVKQSPPDGYTLMFTNSTTMVQNKVLFKKLSYDPDRDFALVAWFNTGHLPTSVNKDIPVKNIPEFAAWCKNRKVSAATYGAGSFAHVVAATLNKSHGFTLEPVHYRGESAMWQDVVSGNVQTATGSYASQLPFLQQGGVRVIAVPTLERMKKLPDVPTFYEQGLTDKAFQVRGWVGCAAPAGTPDAIVQRLSDLMVEGGKSERVLKINDQFGIDEGARDRAYFKKVLDEEGPVVLEVVRSLNIEPT